jgi:hypothetical protein
MAKAKAKGSPKVKAAAKQTASGAKRRQLNRRDSDDKVDRLVVKHFNHLPPQVLENKKIDGKLIREKLKEDIKATVGGCTRLSKTYWQNAAVRCSEGSSAIDKIEPMDGDVRDGLITALTHLLHDNPSKRRPEKFCSYITELKEELAENELVGLITSSLSSRLTASDSWDKVVLAVMEYFGNFGVKTKYASHYDACYSLFDRVAARAYSELHKSNCTWVTFLETHTFVEHLLFDAADMAIVVTNMANLSIALPALCRLNESCSTAQLIFGPLIDDVNVKTFSSNIDKELVFLDSGVITGADLARVKVI